MKADFRKFSTPVQLRRGGGKGGSVLLTVPKQYVKLYDLEKIAEEGGYVVLTLAPMTDVQQPQVPTLEHFNSYDDHVTIRDHQLGRYIDVYVKDHDLWCDFCEAKNCEHIRFAKAIPEIEAIL